MSSPSWSSEMDPEDRVSPERPRISPSPPLSWSSDPEDRVPLARRQVAGGASARRRPAAAGRAPSRRRRAEAGTSSRVGAESPAGTASTVTGQDLANIRAYYQIFLDIGLFLPTPDDRMISSRPGRVAVYEVSFRLGLRLPFPPFFVNLLDYYSLTPSQLVLNSLRTICAFIILCRLHSITPRISLFRSFYTLRAQAGWWLFQPRPGRVLKLLLPSSVKGWKSRFFFADIEQVRAGWGDPDLRPNSNSAILPGDRELLGRLLTADIPRYNLLLSEDNLLMAGIITQSAMKPLASAIRKAAVKRMRVQSGPGEGQQLSAPKRLTVRVSQPPAQQEPPAAPEIDLTADTLLERAVAEGATTEEPGMEEPATTEGPQAPSGPASAEAERSWGGGTIRGSESAPQADADE